MLAFDWLGQIDRQTLSIFNKKENKKFQPVSSNNSI